MEILVPPVSGAGTESDSAWQGQLPSWAEAV